MGNRRSRLAQYVAADRARRFRSREDFARACGISARTIDKIEGGTVQNYAPRTIVAVETCLGWRTGSFGRAIDGHPPIYVSDETLTRLEDLWPRLSESNRALLLRLALEAVETDG